MRVWSTLQKAPPFFLLGEIRGPCAFVCSLYATLVLITQIYCNMRKLFVLGSFTQRDGVTLNEDNSTATKTDSKGNVWLSVQVSETRNVKSKTFDRQEKRPVILKFNPDTVAGWNIKAGMDLAPLLARHYGKPQCVSIVETREPAYDGHEAKINPDTGEQVLVGGAPVYRETHLVDMVWDETGLDANFLPNGAWVTPEDTKVTEDATAAVAAEATPVEAGDLAGG